MNKSTTEKFHEFVRQTYKYDFEKEICYIYRIRVVKQVRFKMMLKNIIEHLTKKRFKMKVMKKEHSE